MTTLAQLFLSNSCKSRCRAVAVLSVFLILLLQTAGAQTFTVLHAFTGGLDGGGPYTGAVDAAGNFYGTAGGGAHHSGMVFKLSQKNGTWVVSALYNFMGGSDGEGPQNGVVFGHDGALYGTTVAGGTASDGTVFKLQPSPTICHSILCPWDETVVHSFAGGADGAQPSSSISFDAAGNFYGTTQNGGAGMYCGQTGCGVVYKLSPANGGWTESIVYAFNGGADGENPAGGVVMNAAGDFFGTCNDNCPIHGSVYELTPNGSGYTKSWLYKFTGGSDGAGPNGLIIDSSGNLYGTTTADGSGGGGTAYDLQPQGSQWFFGVLYPLVNLNPHDYGPLAPLTMDAAGNLYGTSFSGGQYGAGSVFKLTRAGGGWNYTSLHDFTGGDDGGGPESPVVLDSQGNVYGTTYFNGLYSQGVAFKITQ